MAKANPRPTAHLSGWPSPPRATSRPNLRGVDPFDPPEADSGSTVSELKCNSLQRVERSRGGYQSFPLYTHRTGNARVYESRPCARLLC